MKNNICKNWIELDNKIGIYEFCKGTNKKCICSGMQKECSHPSFFIPCITKKKLHID